MKDFGVDPDVPPHAPIGASAPGPIQRPETHDPSPGPPGPRPYPDPRPSTSARLPLDFRFH